MAFLSPTKSKWRIQMPSLKYPIFSRKMPERTNVRQRIGGARIRRGDVSHSMVSGPFQTEWQSTETQEWFGVCNRYPYSYMWAAALIVFVWQETCLSVTRAAWCYHRITVYGSWPDKWKVNVIFKAPHWCPVDISICLPTCVQNAADNLCVLTPLWFLTSLFTHLVSFLIKTYVLSFIFS